MTSPIFTDGRLAGQCTEFFTKHYNAADSTLLDFLRVICLCHDVTKVTNAQGKSFLTGPSQDELCLLDMA